MDLCGANGTRDGTGTHVSVFVYYMRGENDELLPWPFTGKVKIELLNQLEDNNHYSKSGSFPQEHEADQLVMYPCYISHSDLGYNEAKNCQYLKDNWLFTKLVSW